MHPLSLTPLDPRSREAESVRHADAAALAHALTASRADTLATFAVCMRQLAGADVPFADALNPPLWELGHIGWFQSHWIARNPQRALGQHADPHALRSPAPRANADALYDSSRVAHASRWSLPFPDAEATRADLAAQLETTLTLLREAGASDDGLYFHRLTLLHEDMHHEAALYMAQALGLAIEDPRWQASAIEDACAPLAFEAGTWRLGSEPAGFVFDNELGAHPVALPASAIDSRVVRWAEYLPFVEAGGYAQPQWWSEAGRAWLAAHQTEAPRYLRRSNGAWQCWRHGRWSALDPAHAACFLTAFEAEAWCRWAGCRLPTEAEWERAALERPGEFVWGEVWEWTASAFMPYPGFAAHPYREYSTVSFGHRRVLRGASFMTQPRMRHARYRNFFSADRHDVPAGFRACR